MAGIEPSSDDWTTWAAPDDLLPEPTRPCEHWIARVRKAEAEVERLRAALERILDHGQTHEEPCHALHNGDCADVFQEIARAALDG